MHEDSFTGEQFCDWLSNTFTDIKTADEATEWGRSLFDKGLIEHVTAAHGFFNYGHFFYRLRREYDVNKAKRKKPAKSWFGGKPTQDPRDLLERHAIISNPTSTFASLGKLSGGVAVGEKKRKIKMSQTVVVDLDPYKRSDRAEVAVLHADIIHNARNAYVAVLLLVCALMAASTLSSIGWESRPVCWKNCGQSAPLRRNGTACASSRPPSSRSRTFRANALIARPSSSAWRSLHQSYPTCTCV